MYLLPNSSVLSNSCGFVSCVYDLNLKIDEMWILYLLNDCHFCEHQLKFVVFDPYFHSIWTNHKVLNKVQSHFLNTFSEIWE